MSKYNAESPKQGSKKVQFYCEAINIADLGIIYICLDPYARNWGALDLNISSGSLGQPVKDLVPCGKRPFDPKRLSP